MGSYLASRLGQAVVVIFGVTLVTFLALHVVPGDVAVMIGGERATPGQLAHIRQQLGLNDPLWIQYWRYISSAVQGNFGTSLETYQPASTVVLQAFPLTFQLAVLALIVASVAGTSLGVLAARHQGGPLDALSTVVSMVGTASPVFWTGLILLLLGGALLGIFPIGGAISSGSSLKAVTGLTLLDAIITGNWGALGDVSLHLVLPVLTLSLLPTAIIARISRAGMIEVLRLDYVRTARAKGAPRARVTLRHALPNVLLPLITTIGLQFGTLLSGAVLTETVFGLPGLGRVVVNAILARDYPVVQATVILTAIVFTLVNLLVDITYGLVDPRVREG